MSTNEELFSQKIQQKHCICCENLLRLLKPHVHTFYVKRQGGYRVVYGTAPGVLR